MRLYETIETYNQWGPARFHTPGHKGTYSPLGREDVTELPQTACLFDEEGPIRESEKTLAKLMDVEDAFFSAGGATLCIQTMLRLCQSSTVIVGRGAHHSAYNAMALMGMTPISLYPRADDYGLPGRYSPEGAETLFLKHPEAKALYVTSPDYFGCISDIRGLRKVCDAFGAQLLVDNAHGSHLKFCGKGLHPMELGAHWCTDSWHKTLPVLTGGAVLYTSHKNMAPAVKNAMALFGSTSPNFMTLLSMDRCIDYLATDGKADFLKIAEIADGLRGAARVAGFTTPIGRFDPIRVTAGCDKPDSAIATHFRMMNVSPEAVMGGYAIFLLSPQNTEKDFRRLGIALEKWAYPLSYPASVPLPKLEVGMSMGKAVLSDFAVVPIQEAVGKICHNVTNACPPGIPIVLPGEIFSASAAELIKTSGISHVKVVK